MKKIIYTIIASICILSLSSCDSRTTSQKVSDDIKKSQEYHKKLEKEKRAEEQRLTKEILGK